MRARGNCAGCTEQRDKDETAASDLAKKRTREAVVSENDIEDISCSTDEDELEAINETNMISLA